MSTSPDGVWSRLDAESVSNVLLLSPRFNPASGPTCLDLLSVMDLEETYLLGVNLAEPPDDTLKHWRSLDGWPPSSHHIVRVGEPSRASVQGQQFDSNVELVNDPSDLTGIGISINEVLEDTREQPLTVVICFNSLTALLQYAELSRVFRFLHVITQRVKSEGAFAHYHMDPDAHEPDQINTLTGLFDAVVTLDEDGEMTVSQSGV